MMLDNAVARAITEATVGKLLVPIARAYIFFLWSFAFYSGKRFHL